MSFYNRILLRSSIFIMGIFFVSCFKSCQELKYYRSGRTVATTVASMEPQHDDDGGYSVRYDIADPAAKVAMPGFSRVSSELANSLSVGDPIEVEYIGDSPANLESRLKGTGSRGWVWTFFVFLGLMLALMVWVVIALWQGEVAARAERDRQGRRGR